MGNPMLKVLPESRIVVSMSTAVYMAEARGDWANTSPVRPDVFIPQMWRNEDALRANLQTWIDSHTQPSDAPHQQVGVAVVCGLRAPTSKHSSRGP